MKRLRLSLRPQRLVMKQVKRLRLRLRLRLLFQLYRQHLQMKLLKLNRIRRQ